MAINNNPIFTGTIAIGTTKFTQANVNTKQTIFPTTPASYAEGFYAQKVRIKLSSGANTNSHVFELSIYNGSVTGGPGVYDTLLIPATTYLSVASSRIYEIPLNISLPTGWYLSGNFTGTAAGTFTFDVIGIGGTYTQ